MFCCSVQPLCVCSRDDPLASEAIEQIKKGVARILVTEESRLPAFHDIRHALDLKTQIQIRMPSRRQAIQIYFDETLALSDSSPHPTVVAHLAFQ